MINDALSDCFTVTIIVGNIANGRKSTTYIYTVYKNVLKILKWRRVHF